MKTKYTCGICPLKPCVKGEGSFPGNCPTMDKKGITEKAFDLYRRDESVRKIMDVASRLPKDDFGNLRSRAQEIIEFIIQMNFKKIGVAFCSSLGKEAKVFVKMLEEYDLEIYPVCCKVGAKDIGEIGIAKTNSKFSAVCNPVAQAEIMNEAGTELNVVVGLCVGHDIMFGKTIKSLNTTLIAKDRKHEHSPQKGLEC